jgi:uncharacterized membrane protein YvlD (DUF360 family)
MAGSWEPQVPRLRLWRVLVSWLISTAALLAAAGIVPHVSIPSFGGALVVAAIAGALNAVLPPLVAALRLPLTLVTNFVLILALNAVILRVASDLRPEAIQVDSFWWALLTALVAAAVSIVLEILFGANDDDTYNQRVIRRIARRSGERVETDVPGIVFLEIDGLALQVL